MMIATSGVVQILSLGDLLFLRGGGGGAQFLSLFVLFHIKHVFVGHLGELGFCGATCPPPPPPLPVSAPLVGATTYRIADKLLPLLGP